MTTPPGVAPKPHKSAGTSRWKTMCEPKTDEARAWTVCVEKQRFDAAFEIVDAAVNCHC